MLELLTAGEVAALLKVPRQRAYALKERIGYVRLSPATIRFRLEDVLAYVNGQVHPPDPRPQPGDSIRRGPSKRGAPSPRAAAIRERLKAGSKGR